ncbi:23S rRNA (uracil(1939)-C(5))-methyltransferase RlmD [Pseudohongiella nitratireducens]|uniref:23S rRNA (uracil(1939)-C(5))-methyltransferase RlmD n=1 Tax=Pseudohongiella nitratireducens TaxID=1768907 RepID=A0A917LQG5_9GAMM|nr:23S rRNA (uracil(1939)-C(5))-methyltransferase RlmD [Pseudohongiella nitratireducens]MDF1622797.1 23S rRNA (uracil(1939)-C(5))-methyltransferase RlmD [Pseudohongiella nitratireducens]GGG49146.1 23S rRNA (uracil(1939)-C(5))-methyltransferase RlmD [Pseudohongiella nitratireducens]
MGNKRRRRQKLPAEPVNIAIERMSNEGRGIGTLSGKITFVDGALPGEEVTATYTGRRSQYDELKTTEVLSQSSDRVTPPCPVASICGGCTLQHMDSAAQLQFKEGVLLNHLQHSANQTDYEVLPAMAGPTLSYRRKARLGVRYVHRKGDVLVGFREQGNSFITNMEHCPVLVSQVGQLIRPLRDLIHSMDTCREIPQIEVAVGESSAQSDENIDQDLVVSLILRHLQPLADEDLARLKAFADKYDIQWFLQSGGPATVKRFWPESGSDMLSYFLPVADDKSIRMQFSPSDFTQVNAVINRKMIRQAMSLLDLKPDDVVLDLFCGLGNFSLPMAQHCAQVTGVEGSQEMSERATENARLNNIDNARFFSADLFTEFDGQPWSDQHYSKILLDPPRSGAIEIVQRINELAPDVIVYVSCNPATLARDAGELLQQGYQMTHAGVMDMFPHTGHVESMARFVRKGSGA